MTFLLDVNVLIALIDPLHVNHGPAHDWFEREGRRNWATCPMTQNGVLRIVGQPSYPNTPGSPTLVAGIVRDLVALPGHHFWADDVSLLDDPTIDPTRLMTSGQVTDTYLLALAVGHGGRLASFDRKLATGAVRGGRAALHLI